VFNIQGEIVFQKLQNLWVAKALMSSYILCKILSYLTRVVGEHIGSQEFVWQ